MKWLIYAFLILLGAVLLGLFAYQDPGYVLFGRGYTTLEMSLSLFSTLLVLGFILLYFSLRLILRSLRMPARLRKWRLQQRRQKAQRASNRGLIELAEGHWREAERTLLKYVGDSETPLLNYLSAARAAQKQHAHERRDHYLALAHQSTPGADMAVELTQAELQIAHGQLEQALATLVHLQSLAPRHPHVLNLLMLLYEKLHSWEDLRELLPKLEKHQVLTDEEHLALTRQVYLQLLRQNPTQSDKLQSLWQQLPRNLRHDETLVTEYARQLLKLRLDDAAEKLLRDEIRHEWRNGLVYLYGLVRSNQVDRQLHTAETWLKGRDSNATLLLTLGRLAIANKLWGKARAYLEASIGYQPRAETYRELGQLLETMDEAEAAAQHFRTGLLLATGDNRG